MALRQVHWAVVHNSLSKLTTPFSQLLVSLSRHKQLSSLLQSQRSPKCGQGFSQYGACKLHTSSLLSAGHSKWQNIKHVKAANDRIKSLNANALVRKIGACLNKNPNLDLKLNTELAAIQKWARSLNIPSDTFNRQIEKAKQLKDPKNIVTLTGRGLQDTGILIECITLNKKHTLNTLQSMVKKGGFSLHIDATDLFTHKGVVEVVLPEVDLPSAQSDPENFNLDKYVDTAIEAGAEDVTLEPGEEKPYLSFTCGPFDLPKVQLALGEAGMEVSSAERTYSANEVVTIGQDHWELIEKVIAKMDEVPEIMKYHFNFEVKDEEESL